MGYTRIFLELCRNATKPVNPFRLQLFTILCSVLTPSLWRVLIVFIVHTRNVSVGEATNVEEVEINRPYPDPAYAGVGDHSSRRGAYGIQHLEPETHSAR